MFSRYMIPLSCLVALALSAASSSLIGVASADKENLQPPSDEEIAQSVAAEIREDPMIEPKNLKVMAENGVVTLDGEVKSLAAARRAVKISHTIRGVRSTVDRLEIADTSRDDHRIAAAVIAAIGEDSATDSWEIRIDVKDGVVTLMGTVNSYAEKALAEKVATTVTGVRGVKNTLKMQPLDERRDYEIQSDVEQRLKFDVWVDASDIRVEAKDGVVKLSGTVPSAGHRDRAKTNAFVLGVREVDASQLEVDPTRAVPLRRPRPDHPGNDHEIIRAVEAALAADPRVEPYGIQVTSNKGLVTLVGEVDNLKARRAAEEDALNTRGVWEVTNEITVQKDQEDVRLVERRASAALKRDAYTSGLNVAVDVSDGTATLTGTVPSQFLKAHAEDVISRLRGVLAINNEIEVEPPTNQGLSDLDIKYRIRNRFYWSPYIDTRNVQIRVHDGAATLTGTVRNQEAYQFAADHAIEAGAQRVLNELKVENRDPVP